MCTTINVQQNKVIKLRKIVMANQPKQPSSDRVSTPSTHPIPSQQVCSHSCQPSILYIPTQIPALIYWVIITLAELSVLLPQMTDQLVQEHPHPFPLANTNFSVFVFVWILNVGPWFNRYVNICSFWKLV